MIIGALAAYNNVHNFTQQQVSVAQQAPATVSYQQRNAAIAPALTRQAVKVADGSNKSELTKRRQKKKANYDDPSQQHMGRDVDVEI